MKAHLPADVADKFIRKCQLTLSEVTVVYWHKSQSRGSYLGLLQADLVTTVPDLIRFTYCVKKEFPLSMNPARTDCRIWDYYPATGVLEGSIINDIYVTDIEKNLALELLGAIL